jgi:MinD-like ATPase involved in chromosome partitioning or flagellar assembly
MRGVRIPHDVNGEDQFVLGLSVTRLAALLFGLLVAYTILHLSFFVPLRFAAAALAALAGAALAWIRPEGRSLTHWLLAAIEYKFGSRAAAIRPSMPSTSAAQGSLNRIERHHRSPRFRVVAPAIASATSSTPAGQPAPATSERAGSAIQPAYTGEDALASNSDDVIELPDDRAYESSSPACIDVDPDPNDAKPAPVYLGGPQVITFFAAKGGTGRTTLATEVASLLAMKGRYQETPASPPQALRVALVDFDLGSANVSARLGLAQPTMLDYLCDLSVPQPDPHEYVIRHPAANLDVMLGPSKCLAGDRAELLGVPQAAHILSTLKSAGYHFLVVDISSALGSLETYLLEAATRVYCVVTPTAGSVQSLYRGVEALRRLGLGSKLRYVANKMRDGVSLEEPMGDLNGTLVARIPYDAAFDTAENRHEPLSIRGRGPAVDALRQLAASIYPALELPVPLRSIGAPFSWFSKRRRAG